MTLFARREHANRYIPAMDNEIAQLRQAVSRWKWLSLLALCLATASLTHQLWPRTMLEMGNDEHRVRLSPDGLTFSYGTRMAWFKVGARPSLLLDGQDNQRAELAVDGLSLDGRQGSMSLHPPSIHIEGEGRIEIAAKGDRHAILECAESIGCGLRLADEPRKASLQLLTGIGGGSPRLYLSLDKALKSLDVHPEKP
jgi:hypothetical protein